MPQLVVNMKIRALKNIGCKLKVNSFKMRHAPYSNRYPTYQKRKKGLKTVENERDKKYWLLHKAKECYAHICFFANTMDRIIRHSEEISSLTTLKLLKIEQNEK